MHFAHMSLVICRQGPTERSGTEGGVSGPAEDLRPVSEVEAGVNFWRAGQVRGQVVEHCPVRRPRPGTRWSHPPGGSSHAIRAAWARMEGVWYRGVGGLGAKG